MFKNKYKFLNIVLIIVSLALLIVSYISFNEKPKQFIVVLDHSKLDDGVEESIDLQIVKSIKNELSNDSKYKVFILNEENKTMYVSERLDLISQIKPDVVLSIQNNLNNEENILGFEIYCMKNEFNEESIRLANSLKEALVSNGITPNEQGIFYYDLPLVKDNIHRVSVVSVDGEVSEEKTLKILEESSVNTVVISKSYVSSDADINVELLKNISKAYHDALNIYFTNHSK